MNTEDSEFERIEREAKLRQVPLPAKIYDYEEAYFALKAKLAEQPAQQEHVADGLIRQYINAVVLNNPDEAANVAKAMVDYVYTTPQPAQRTWVGLTDEEAESVIDEIPGFAFGLDDGNLANGCVVLYANAIEAKLKEKNNG